jgi:CRP-like cAMP-binding protein
MQEDKPTDRDEGALRKHLERFVPLTDREFSDTLTYFTTRNVKKNSILLQPGEAVHYTFWVVNGLLLSVFNDGEGKEHIMQFATENCWITDQYGFYYQQPAILRIEALEDSTLLSLSFTDREKLCEAIPKMNHFFRRKANDSFVKQQKRLLTYMTSMRRSDSISSCKSIPVFISAFRRALSLPIWV